MSRSFLTRLLFNVPLELGLVVVHNLLFADDEQLALGQSHERFVVTPSTWQPQGRFNVVFILKIMLCPVSFCTRLITIFLSIETWIVLCNVRNKCELSLGT